jgi:hypothetical protein
MADFSIGSVGKELGDIQRTYTWELRLTPPNKVLADLPINEDMIKIRCRSVVIPGRSQEFITSNFMGMEQFFPGRVKFTNPFNITFEEFEDRTIARFLYAWQQKLFQTTEGATGGSGFKKSEMVAESCNLILLDYQGNEVSDNKCGVIQINNAWPESVAEVPMSYAESTALQYALSIRYDTWEYKGV